MPSLQGGKCKGGAMNKKELLKELIAAERAEPTQRITCPGDIYPVLAKYAKSPVEKMFATSLDGAHNIIHTHNISVGLLNRCLVHPREVFNPLVKDRAAAFILAHNHPSGNLELSDEDYQIVDRFKKAGEVMGIPMLDNIVFSTEGYHSSLEEGEL